MKRRTFLAAAPLAAIGLPFARMSSAQSRRRRAADQSGAARHAIFPRRACWRPPRRRQLRHALRSVRPQRRRGDLASARHIGRDRDPQEGRLGGRRRDRDQRRARLPRAYRQRHRRRSLRDAVGSRRVARRRHRRVGPLAARAEPRHRAPPGEGGRAARLWRGDGVRSRGPSMRGGSSTSATASCAGPNCSSPPSLMPKAASRSRPWSLIT